MGGVGGSVGGVGASVGGVGASVGDSVCAWTSVGEVVMPITVSVLVVAGSSSVAVMLLHHVVKWIGSWKCFPCASRDIPSCRMNPCSGKDDPKPPLRELSENTQSVTGQSTTTVKTVFLGISCGPACSVPPSSTDPVTPSS